MNLSSALTLDGSQVGNPVVAKLSELLFQKLFSFSLNFVFLNLFFKLFNLGELLDDRDLEVRTKVAEGLCKLMMSKVITSSKLFTRLILVSSVFNYKSFSVFFISSRDVTLGRYFGMIFWDDILG